MLPHYSLWFEYGNDEGTFVGLMHPELCSRNIQAVPILKEKITAAILSGETEFLIITAVEEFVVVYLKYPGKEIMVFIHHSFDLETKKDNEIIMLFKKEIREAQKAVKAAYKGKPMQSIDFSYPTLPANN